LAESGHGFLATELSCSEWFGFRDVLKTDWVRHAAAAGAFAFLIASANVRHRFAAPAGDLIVSGSPYRFGPPA
jgi:hypothetical protein